MIKQTKVWLVLSITLSLALASACGGGTTNSTTPPANTESAAGPYSGPTGTISGVISFEGEPPAPRKIDTSADPACGQANPNLTTDDTVVKDGKLANAFIYIKEGTVESGGKKVDDFTWTPPATAVNLDQNGCHYKPHVLGIQVNQKLSVTNSDKTQHNVHPTPKNNPEWNQTQAVGAGPIEKTFARPETLIPVKCNQHPWMKAYIGVMRTPFFAVSGEDGMYKISDVPAGTYTVVAWREGGANGTEKTMQVTVPANGDGKADFSFGGAASASSNPSLKMMPAIEFPMLHRH
ncbi:MAG TPA: carboxypeptidase regulatory-like domain-containing protein [Pyrinomonadaceae bacterium]|nr:carboxypeptidase regulatory-like domain-containing protein [Pyrinomonadaceae bacterium]